MAAPAFLPELATQVVVPVAAVVGIAFAVLQWVLVSKVKLSPEPRRGDGSSAKSGAGPSEYLIEEEEGLNEHNVVVKCAEIQNAISEGEAERLRPCSCFFF
jgi:H+-translocating diphosphatase